MSYIRNVELAPDLYMILSKGGSPTDNEWALALQKAKLISVKRVRRLFVSLDGSALTTSQRRQMDKLLHEKQIECRTAVMTTSPAVRALFTVFRWLGRNSVKVFAMDDLAHACLHLEMSASEVVAAEQELARELLSIKRVG